MEVRGARTFCRGLELHVIIGTSWYRTDLGLLGRRLGLRHLLAQDLVARCGSGTQRGGAR